MSVTIDKILIIGVGLIGGSLALALRKAGAVKEIIGAGRSIESLEKARELNVIDRYVEQASSAVTDVDVIVVATPVLTTDAVIEQIAGQDYQHAVVTDVGSVKQGIVQSAKRHFSDDYRGFVAAHPIAGRENSGVEAATDNLFEGKQTIITPSSQSGERAIKLVREMWVAVGSTVAEVDASDHDNLVSASSHLPHVVAFSLVNYIANHARSKECFDLAASGFFDFTRIASSDPVMWRDISLANSDALVREVRGLIDNLEQMIRKISDGEAEHLYEMFRVAKESRDFHLARWKK